MPLSAGVLVVLLAIAFKMVAGSVLPTQSRDRLHWWNGWWNRKNKK
ncbi:hypothetical protein ABT034_06885 [Streptomyces sp. NPDC002773]